MPCHAVSCLVCSCGVVWCGVVWCGVVWCGVVWWCGNVGVVCVGMWGGECGGWVWVGWVVWGGDSVVCIQLQPWIISVAPKSSWEFGTQCAGAGAQGSVVFTQLA